MRPLGCVLFYVCAGRPFGQVYSALDRSLSLDDDTVDGEEASATTTTTTTPLSERAAAAARRFLGEQEPQFAAVSAEEVAAEREADGEATRFLAALHSVKAGGAAKAAAAQKAAAATQAAAAGRGSASGRARGRYSRDELESQLAKTVAASENGEGGAAASGATCAANGAECDEKTAASVTASIQASGQAVTAESCQNNPVAKCGVSTKDPDSDLPFYERYGGRDKKVTFDYLAEDTEAEPGTVPTESIPYTEIDCEGEHCSPTCMGVNKGGYSHTFGETKYCEKLTVDECKTDENCYIMSAMNYTKAMDAATAALPKTGSREVDESWEKWDTEQAAREDEEKAMLGARVQSWAACTRSDQCARPDDWCRVGDKRCLSDDDCRYANEKDGTTRDCRRMLVEGDQSKIVGEMVDAVPAAVGFFNTSTHKRIDVVVEGLQKFANLTSDFADWGQAAFDGNTRIGRDENDTAGGFGPDSTNYHHYETASGKIDGDRKTLERAFEEWKRDMKSEQDDVKRTLAGHKADIMQAVKEGLKEVDRTMDDEVDHVEDGVKMTEKDYAGVVKDLKLEVKTLNKQAEDEQRRSEATEKQLVAGAKREVDAPVTQNDALEAGEKAAEQGFAKEVRTLEGDIDDKLVNDANLALAKINSTNRGDMVKLGVQMDKELYKEFAQWGPLMQTLLRKNLKSDSKLQDNALKATKKVASKSNEKTRDQVHAWQSLADSIFSAVQSLEIASGEANETQKGLLTDRAKSKLEFAKSLPKFNASVMSSLLLHERAANDSKAIFKEKELSIDDNVGSQVDWMLANMEKNLLRKVERMANESAEYAIGVHERLREETGIFDEKKAKFPPVWEEAAGLKAQGDHVNSRYEKALAKVTGEEQALEDMLRKKQAEDKLGHDDLLSGIYREREKFINEFKQETDDGIKNISDTMRPKAAAAIEELHKEIEGARNQTEKDEEAFGKKLTGIVGFMSKDADGGPSPFDQIQTGSQGDLINLERSLMVAAAKFKTDPEQTLSSFEQGQRKERIHAKEAVKTIQQTEKQQAKSADLKSKLMLQAEKQKRMDIDYRVERFLKQFSAKAQAKVALELSKIRRSVAERQRQEQVQATIAQALQDQKDAWNSEEPDIDQVALNQHMQDYLRQLDEEKQSTQQFLQKTKGEGKKWNGEAIKDAIGPFVEMFDDAKGTIQQGLSQLENTVIENEKHIQTGAMDIQREQSSINAESKAVSEMIDSALDKAAVNGDKVDSSASNTLSAANRAVMGLKNTAMQDTNRISDETRAKLQRLGQQLKVEESAIAEDHDYALHQLAEDFDHRMSIESEHVKQTEEKTKAEEVRAEAQAEGNRIALDEGEKRFETAHDQLKMATDSSLLVLANQKKTQLGKIGTAAANHNSNAEMIRKSTEGVKNQTASVSADVSAQLKMLKDQALAEGTMTDAVLEEAFKRVKQQAMVVYDRIHTRNAELDAFADEYHQQTLAKEAPLQKEYRRADERIHHASVDLAGAQDDRETTKQQLRHYLARTRLQALSLIKQMQFFMEADTREANEQLVEMEKNATKFEREAKALAGGSVFTILQKIDDVDRFAHQVVLNADEVSQWVPRQHEEVETFNKNTLAHLKLVADEIERANAMIEKEGSDLPQEGKALAGALERHLNGMVHNVGGISLDSVRASLKADADLMHENDRSREVTFDSTYHTMETGMEETANRGVQQLEAEAKQEHLVEERTHEGHEQAVEMQQQLVAAQAAADQQNEAERKLVLDRMAGVATANTAAGASAEDAAGAIGQSGASEAAEEASAHSAEQERQRQLDESYRSVQEHLDQDLRLSGRLTQEQADRDAKAAAETAGASSDAAAIRDQSRTAVGEGEFSMDTASSDKDQDVAAQEAMARQEEAAEAAAKADADAAEAEAQAEAEAAATAHGDKLEVSDTDEASLRDESRSAVGEMSDEDAAAARASIHKVQKQPRGDRLEDGDIVEPDVHRPHKEGAEAPRTKDDPYGEPVMKGQERGPTDDDSQALRAGTAAIVGDSGDAVFNDDSLRTDPVAQHKPEKEAGTETLEEPEVPTKDGAAGDHDHERKEFEESLEENLSLGFKRADFAASPRAKHLLEQARNLKEEHDRLEDKHERIGGVLSRVVSAVHGAFGAGLFGLR